MDLHEPRGTDTSTDNIAREEKPPEHPSQESDMISWSDEEEKQLVRKIDLLVMPLLMILYLAMEVDRANIGNALTDNFLHDVAITQDWFNVGQQLLSAGLAIFEIPCNMVLYRIGPNIWITCQIIVWGLAASFQAFQHGLGAFLATRLLLGLLEAGFMPAGLYTISLWYKHSETSKRYAGFYGGYILGLAVNGLIAYGILHMRGIGNLAGWQWLFLLEGIFTILMGVLFACIFPGSPQHPRSLFRLRYFSERETTILQQRLVLDDPSKYSGKQNISLSQVLHTLKEPRVWLHVLPALSGAIPISALTIYTPTLIHMLGYDALASNAMASVPQWISLLLILAAGYLADRTGQRGLIVLIGVVITMLFSITFRCLPDHASAATKYGILIMRVANYMWWCSVNASWLSVNCQSQEERAVALALLTMFQNVSMVAGAQVFRSDDLPLYHRAWSIIVAVDCASVVFVIVLLILYRISRSRDQKDRDVHGGTEGTK